MRFTHNDVNFDVKYEGHQNCSKTLSKHILRVLVTIICDVKIDVNMCEPHYVNLFFFVNLLHSPCVWLFDIWHLFDNLTSFWQLDIFMTTWHLFWHLDNGKCGQMGIMVNTEDRDEVPWGMGHMGDGAHGQHVCVVMC